MSALRELGEGRFGEEEVLRLATPRLSWGESSRRDYERVERALSVLSSGGGLSEAAVCAGVSERQLQRLCMRWAGASPKELQQASASARCRAALASESSVLEASYAAGLSGPGRMHELMVRVAAMTPGEARRRGEGLRLSWGFHDSPFGVCVSAMSERGLAGLGFCGGGVEERATALADMKGRFPAAMWREDSVAAEETLRRIFEGGGSVSLILVGANFEIRVWRALLGVGVGGLVSYGELGRRVGVERGARAVGGAVGRNPLSWIVPCHRALRASGELGGYHWGLLRKRAMLGVEAGLLSGVLRKGD